jgi:hypothetical protein
MAAGGTDCPAAPDELRAQHATRDASSAGRCTNHWYHSSVSRWEGGKGAGRARQCTRNSESATAEKREAMAAAGIALARCGPTHCLPRRLRIVYEHDRARVLLHGRPRRLVLLVARHVP